MFGGVDIEVLGFAVSPEKHRKITKLNSLTRETLALLGVVAPSGLSTRLHIDDRFYGAGYACVEPRAVAAIRRLAELEAILLDPVYTDKAMAGLISAIETGTISSSKKILFVHTGGAPALFAYRSAI